MQEYTIIFIGKSGAGKGTQIDRLFEYLKAKGESDTMYLGAGQTLRDFVATDTYTSRLAKTGNLTGKLQPGFLAVWACANKMINEFTGQKIVCVDGAPRKLNEAYILDEMFDFYNRHNRIVVHLNVTDDWARGRLKDRGREDDLKTDSVENRLDWFAQSFKDVLSFFEQSGKYKILTIHGEQDIDRVHDDIIKSLQI